MKPIPELAKFLSDLPDIAARESFARRCGTTLGQLKQVAGGHRRCGESLAINIDRESRGALPCERFRPDVDWAYLRGTVRRRIRGAVRATR
jgi:DNA-binding transcriptional regulator YdaS (Cro superfamily)